MNATVCIRRELVPALMTSLNVPEKRYATVPQVALFTGLSDGTIRNLLATGQLTGYRPVPGRILLDLREVENFMHESAKRRCGTRGCKPHGVGIDGSGERKHTRPPPKGSGPA
jgi:excisionase family DNA binding protein